MSTMYDQSQILRRTLNESDADNDGVTGVSDLVTRILSMELVNSGSASCTFAMLDSLTSLPIWQLDLTPNSVVIIPHNDWGIMESSSGAGIIKGKGPNTAGMINFVYVQI